MRVLSGFALSAEIVRDLFPDRGDERWARTKFITHLFRHGIEFDPFDSVQRIRAGDLDRLAIARPPAEAQRFEHAVEGFGPRPLDRRAGDGRRRA